MTGIIGLAQQDRADAWCNAPFDGCATEADIAACFRLLLGRNPHAEEWRGHSMRAGEDLRGVVESFLGSLEFARRGLARAPDPSAPTTTFIEGFHLYTAPDDASVGALVRSGAYEKEVCAVFCDRLRPGMRVLDIGANIGFFTMLAASLVGPAGHVLAVEPNGSNVRLLEASRRRNGFDNVSVLQVAAGRQHGLLVLNASYSNGTTAALPDGAEAVLVASTVPALRLDALLSPETAIDFVKIDVEGAEYTALAGCEAMLRRDRPTIVTEFSPGLMPGISGVDGPTYLRWLQDLGYHLSAIQPDGTASQGDVETLMRTYETRASDHIDILALSK